MEDTRLSKYMELFLGELGWDKGTRIPLADLDNKNLESSLISRQQEIQQLKETLILQSKKCKDLSNYKEHVQSEYQENTKLLFANKQQLEQEIKLKQLAFSEADVLEHELLSNNKNINDISSRVDRLQINTGRLLKKADLLKNEVCGERGALQEWRAALERSAGDISAIEQFTKQDISKAKALETKRQKLKLEHDHMLERLNQLVSNLSAEERSCERISVQVLEGMDQRQQMMEMWSNAVENLRQRDNDIKNIREDYKVLEEESNRLTEQCRDQQTFCDQQRGNNADAERDNMAAAHRLSLMRHAHSQLIEQCVTLDTEVQAMQRELSNVRVHMEKLHMENRGIMENQHRKDVALKALNMKIEDLREKKTGTLDKTQSSEKRAKELERMLTDEERFMNQLNTSQQRAMHCSFVEQQKLATLTNEEKMFYMQLKASKASISKLETKHRMIEKNLLAQKETLYGVFYQVETIGARVSHMEGVRSEREFSAELVEKEKRLQDVRARHAARVALLERHSSKLEDDLRRLTKDLEAAGLVHNKLQSRLKSLVLTVEGGEKEVQNSREAWRRARVDEALLRVRLSQATKALNALTDAAYDMDTQRLNLEAAMKERLVEINVRQDMFNVQKRALFEECGKLKTEIKEREIRIAQLKKRYDIFIASLGKDDSGEQLSVTYFKVKIAAERAELREQGAALDASLSRGERDVAALEHTLRLVTAAHLHFLRRLAPLSAQTPEMEEIQVLQEKFYQLRDDLQQLRARCETAERELGEVIAAHTSAAETNNQLTMRESDIESDLEGVRERLRRQESKLENARESLRLAANRAKRLLSDDKQWTLFQLGMWVREYVWSAHAALTALAALPDATLPRTLSVCLAQHHLSSLLPKQRSLHNILLRIITNTQEKGSSEDLYDESLLSRATSSRTVSSIVSCNTRRLRAFRHTLASKLDEPSLATDKDAPRSSVPLRVVTLGLDHKKP